MMQYQTAEDAVSSIKSGERVFIQGAAATPQPLVRALSSRYTELRNVEIVHLHTEGDAPYASKLCAEAFTVNSFFVAANIRNSVNHQHIQYIPIFLSEIPALFRKGKMPLDTALIHVSPPDIHGFCSLGVSVDVAKAATDVAKKLIALVNPNMPRSHGDSQIHESRFAAAVYSQEPLFEFPTAEANENELAIGRNIASLIEDGATLQLGIGAIPSAALKFLGEHKNLGIHTEMFTDSILPLVKSGVINGKLKRKHPGKIVSTFAMGTRELYDFIDDNPMVAMLDAGYVNDTSVIQKNNKVVAINSAIEIDLTGQVCADSIGSSIYSGVGGQMDFMRGASLSEGGKAIIAMSATTAKGISKIVPTLKVGAGVVTTRAHVHYVVTEFGIADLYGKNISQRSKALIAISHPDHRLELEQRAHELFGKN